MVIDFSIASSTPIAATSSARVGASGALDAINVLWISGSLLAVPKISSVNVTLTFNSFISDLLFFVDILVFESCAVPLRCYTVHGSSFAVTCLAWLCSSSAIQDYPQPRPAMLCLCAATHSFATPLQHFALLCCALAILRHVILRYAFATRCVSLAMPPFATPFRASPLPPRALQCLCNALPCRAAPLPIGG